jgi:predicted AlkP superfamily pyrophosphatase or phosphodiesterase
MVVADQFRFDYLERFRADYTAGFKQLFDQGAFFTQAYYEHFPTVTAVGHSTVLSGALPSSSGIVGNEWLDRATGKTVTSVSDDDTQLLGGGENRKGASPHRLLVSTVGDELKLSDRAPAKIIGVSLKDRAAILPAGHMADGAYWFDSTTGNFVSSTYYFQQLPAWASEFNRQRAVDQYAGKAWTPAWGGTAFLTLPAKPGRQYWEACTATSFGNDMLETFAEAAIDGEKLGQDGGTDILALSFSSNDILGHKVGPNAPQVRDISIRTDRALGRLFDFLDKRIGMSNVLVIFTADHGVAPLPEYLAEHKMPGGRATETEIVDAVRNALNTRYGKAEWIQWRSGLDVFLNHSLIEDKGLSLDEVEETAASAIRTHPAVARVYTREQLLHGLTQADAVGRRMQNGLFYSRAADLFIVPRPYWLFEKTGTTHGSPWNYDAHVPLVLLGPGIRPGRYDRHVMVNDIAPTLAAILRIETPSGAFGRVLDEALLGRR